MADTFTVQRSTTIQAPPAGVYAHVVDLRRWSAWSPWEDLDPSMRKSYSGPESGPGAVYSWAGNRKVGEGSMEITGVTEPSRVEIDLEFVKPFRASNTSVLSLEPEGDGTRVTWSVSGPTTLMTRVMGVFRSMDRLMGPDFERGLAKLKKVAEASGS